MNFLGRTTRTVGALGFRRFARSYATESTGASDKLRLSFAVPHETLYDNAEVQQVNLSSTAGDMGILANHLATIQQLKPGVVEVVENSTTTKKFFVSGGFATVNPDSSLDINAVEAFPLEHFSIEAIRANLAEAQRISASSATEADRAAARVEVEVLEALQTALGKS
ncbi:1558_t:CDS:2 [Paraglomus occultum]|uniref:ATP synthase subunit delta, mitochondrial n=1 Tax=Paraglomus occultum TaxID=144539 RepID=A0A9N9EXX1_9GLOM|nr:1558_t:CDS:2 [Paraglomus occultum]